MRKNLDGVCGECFFFSNFVLFRKSFNSVEGTTYGMACGIYVEERGKNQTYTHNYWLEGCTSNIFFFLLFSPKMCGFTFLLVVAFFSPLLLFHQYTHKNRYTYIATDEEGKKFESLGWGLNAFLCFFRRTLSCGMRFRGESEKTRKKCGNRRDIFFAVKRERFSFTAAWFCVYVYCFCWRLIFSRCSLSGAICLSKSANVHSTSCTALRLILKWCYMCVCMCVGACGLGATHIMSYVSFLWRWIIKV